MQETNTAAPLTGAGTAVDAAFVRRALEQANPNALRLALYLATGDEALAAMRPNQRRARGGLIVVPQLSEADSRRVVEIAFDWLHPAPRLRPATLRPDEGSKLLALFGADISTAPKLRLALDELGVLDPDRAAATRRAVSPAQRAATKVVIIGAGVSGISAALRCQAAGLPFEILERQADIGGTWNLNDYPEARVDISNFVYQFRFEANYRWRELYSTQKDIQAYLKYIVAKHGLAPAIRLGAEVTAAVWDDGAGQWRLEIARADGRAEQVTANFLISASGLFNVPNIPEIPGLADFKGPLFHTTHWDHSVDLAGKRVALVGSGSTGVQVMPWLAKRAGTLTVYQRSPNWITPVEDYHGCVSPEQQWLFDVLPTYWNWYCFAMMLVDKQSEDLQVDDPDWRAKGGAFNERNDRLRRYLESYLRGKLGTREDLVAACLPSYPPLARRLVVDNGWFDSLLAPNVTLVPHGLRAITERGIVSEDGETRPYDAIVLGTGFQVENFLSTAAYVGDCGVLMSDVWKRDGARAYLGMFVPAFPNLVMFYGPNGQPQTGSFHDWADRWARCSVDLILETLNRGAGAFRVRELAFESYNSKMDAAMTRMVWGRDMSGGYYINAFGRPITKMPWRSEDYFVQIDELDLSAFDFM